jgi:hypothetical protein
LTRTLDDLKVGVDAVKYELTSLINSSKAAQYLGKAKAAPGNTEEQLWQVLSNCTLEAFLLHYRNLKAFLNNGKYSDDVKAEHYSDTWCSKSIFAGETPDEDDRLNKLLAHISYSRENLTRDWALPKLEQQLCDTFREFLRQVRPEYAALFGECVRVLSCVERYG